MKTETRVEIARARILPLLCCAALLVANASQAQPQSAPGATPSPDQVGSASTDAGAPAASQPVRLSAYEVEESTDKGYGALNSNGITGFNVALEKMPVTADIFDQAFMNDIGATSVEGMLSQFSAGFGTNNGSAAAAEGLNQPGDRNGSANYVMRGLNAPGMTVNGFMPVGGLGTTITNYSSSFAFDRVEVVMGPQALLYGTGGAGGVLNVVTKQAIFDQAATATFKFQLTDQYGHKLSQLDYGMGTDEFAVRVALLDQDYGFRRLNLGGPLKGMYAQFAFKLFKNTVVRMDTMRQEIKDDIFSTQDTLLATSTATDARNGDSLAYLLATHQVMAAANGGASGAGPIDNGLLNWNNAYSYNGSQDAMEGFDQISTLDISTKWTNWLSTQILGGYKTDPYTRNGTSASLVPPSFTADNPYGVWVMRSATENDAYQAQDAKAVRFNVLLTNDLFHGFAHSQTNIGGDYNRTNSTGNNYAYYQADSNWNVLYNSTTTALTGTAGRTLLTPVYWSVDGGPVKNVIWTPFSPRITYNGNNYVRMLMNPTNAALVNLNTDPLGVFGQGNAGDYETEKVLDRGVYAVNYTSWMNDKLTSMAGFRLADDDFAFYLGQSKPAPQVSTNASFNFNFGLDYAVQPWLRPYVEISDSYNPPLGLNANPDGATPPQAHALGEEAGLKLQNASGSISGSIAFYVTQSQNEDLILTAAQVTDVNPSGLNGTYLSPSINLATDRKTRGIQTIFTALPTPNWRIRISAAYSDGTTATGTSFAQLYNDQFYENSSGQVTYADGSVVYVAPTFNSKTPVVPSTTAGAIPLTVTAMSTPGNAYFANPVAVNGQIASTSSVYTVLQQQDPVHGPILTGKTGLPITSYQLNQSLTGVQLPGSIVTSIAGDPTYGYPELTLNLVNLYTFPSGWLKGFKVGETLNINYRVRMYPYFPNGISAQSTDRMYYAPNSYLLGGILGYQRKFGRLLFTTQLNVNNIFNHYDILMEPNAATGYTGLASSLQATLSTEPRTYYFTTTIGF